MKHHGFFKNLPKYIFMELIKNGLNQLKLNEIQSNLVIYVGLTLNKDNLPKISKKGLF